MRALYKALFEEVKAHNASRDYLSHYNKEIELLAVFPSSAIGGLAFYVYCTFKTEWELDDNVVVYKVHIYPDGDIEVYYNQTCFCSQEIIEEWKKAV